MELQNRKLSLRGRDIFLRQLTPRKLKKSRSRSESNLTEGPTVDQSNKSKRGTEEFQWPASPRKVKKAKDSAPEEALTEPSEPGSSSRTQAQSTDTSVRTIFLRLFRRSGKEQPLLSGDKGEYNRRSDYHEYSQQRRRIEPDTISLPEEQLDRDIEMNIDDQSTSNGQQVRLLPLSELYQEKGRVSGPELQTYAEYAKLILDSNASELRPFLSDYLTTLQKIEADKAKARPSGVAELDKELANLPKTNTTTIKLNELVITPEVFNGDKPKPRRWLKDYGEAILANGWSDKLAIKYLPTFLAKAAKDWYFTEVRPKLDENTRWANVHALFTANYLGEADYIDLSRAIDKSVQRPDEKAANFIPRMRRLVEMLSPDIGELELVRKLKEKLRPEYKQLINLQPTRTIAELKDICSRIESGFADKPQKTLHTTSSFGSTRRPYRNNRTTRQSAPRRDIMRPHFAKSSQPRRTTFTEVRKPDEAGKGTKDLVCYNCDKAGHMARDCRSARRIRTNQSRQVNVLNEAELAYPDTKTVTVVTHNHKKPDASVAIATIEPSTIIATIGNCKYVYKKILCNGVPINAAIDSGAKISVLKESELSAKGWKANGPVIPLHGANGKLMEAQRSIYLDVQMSTHSTTKKKTHLFAVMKELTEPMLIGRDLLHDLGVIVDHSNDEIKFAKGGNNGGVRTKDGEVIPARSQAIVTARAKTVGTVLVKPFYGTSGLSVANSISEVVDSELPLLLLNATESPIKLEAHAQLASYEQVEPETESNAEKGKHEIRQVIHLEDSDEVIKVGEQLNPSQVNQLRILLQTNKEVFSLKGELGETNAVKHTIELLPGASPIVEPLRRRAQIQIDETRRQVNDLLKQGIIEESSSPWASAYVLAKKKNGEFRLCIDFRKLNLVTKKVVYPLPNIEACLDTLSGKQYFSQLDFKSGFWQIPMDPSSKELTAFRTEDGLFHFNRMPFGLTNAPASFQKMINAVLAGLTGLNLQVFIDDVCLATKTWEEHVKLLQSTFSAILKAGLKVKADKCIFGADTITFLGHEISRSGIRQEPGKLKALDQLPVPRDAKEVKQALGMFSYYRKFVSNFAILAEPLTRLTRKGIKFEWTDEQDCAFKTIIAKLKENATLAHFNHNDPIMVKTDASRKGVAGMLLQHQAGDWRIVTCCSRRLTESEANYGITDLEGLAIIYTVQKLRPYLLGKPFKILTDHCALCVLNKREPVSQRLKRWAIVLSEFEFEIVYTKGKLHSDVDCLSRAPVDNPVDSFLEHAVYLVTPYNKLDWISQYTDNESKEIFTKAIEGNEKLRIIDDVIYYEDRLYVPHSRRHDIVYPTHNDNMNAHPGVRATLAKLTGNYWWPKMYETVEQVVKVCSRCIMNKPERARPAGNMYSHEIYEAGEQVAIDCLGPLTETINGNLHIIVSIDAFTRFVDAKAVSDISAPTFVQYFLEYCGRFGVPHSILTDNSTTFSNAFVEEVRKVLGAAHLKATPRHSQGNAIVERVIQTIQEKLRLCLDDPLQESNWDAALPIAVLSINTAYHSSLGYTPYELMYGRKPPVQDKNLSLKSSPQDVFAKLIKLQMRDYHANAVAIMSSAQDRSKHFYEDRRRERLLAVGDSVVYKAPDRKSKLAEKFKGPCKIVEVKRDIYTLVDEKTGKKYTRHVSDIKPFLKMNAITILMLTMLATLVSGEREIVFNKLKPVVWLATKSQVELGTMEYDIHFAYTNPCHLFESNIKSRLSHDEKLSPDQVLSLQTFNSSCNALYIMEWQQEVTQLAAVKLPSHPIDFRIEPDRPYDEQTRKKRDIEVPLDSEPLNESDRAEMVKRQFLALLGMGDCSFCEPSSLKELREQASNLTRLWHEIESYNSLDWYLLRIESEGILNDTESGSHRLMIKRASLSEFPDEVADRIKYIGLPSDYNAWDIIQMCLFFWTDAAVTERAQYRTYENYIRKIQRDIKELLAKPKNQQYADSLVKEDSIKSLDWRYKPKLPALLKATEKEIAELVERWTKDETAIRELIRYKRNIIASLAGEALQQAVGVFTGNIVSNLVSLAIEKINPYSNTNRLGRLEAAYRDMQANFEVQKQLDRGVLENLDKLNNVVQQTVHRLNEHIRSFPEFTWLATLIVTKMTQASLDLQRVADEAKKGRIAVGPFARLTGLTELKEVESENTRFLSVTKINDHTLNFKFLATVESPDTSAYEVFAFPHWDNLDETPRYLEYSGSKYLIYNSTSNCIKSLANLPTHIVDQCTELDGTDPALSQWKVSRETEDIEKYANQSIVYKTLRSNLIYCFPGKIDIDGHTYTCPYEPFELPPNRGFKTAQQRHIPSLYSARFDQTTYAISAIHAGHYPPDSDAVQHLALFEKLRKERQEKVQLLKELEERVPIVKGGGFFWSIISFSVGSIIGAIVYCIVIYKLKSKIQSLRRPKPNAPTSDDIRANPIGQLVRASSKAYIPLDILSRG